MLTLTVAETLCETELRARTFSTRDYNLGCQHAHHRENLDVDLLRNPAVVL